MTETEWETATWVASAIALAAVLAVPVTCWLLLHGRTLPARLARATAVARRSEAAARLGDQDDLVQTLVVATYALQLGDHDRARDAVDGALRRSRVTLDQLLAEAGRSALTSCAPRADHTALAEVALAGDALANVALADQDHDPRSGHVATADHGTDQTTAPRAPAEPARARPTDTRGAAAHVASGSPDKPPRGRACRSAAPLRAATRRHAA
jgi:hypothetical protein